MRKPLSIVLGFAAIVALGALASSVPPADPTAAARLNNLGAAYMNQQLFEKALKAFEAAAEKNPALKVAVLNRGIALLNLQKLDEAGPVLEKAAKDDAGDAHAWFNLGLYHRNASEPEAALEDFRRVTEIDANDADSWYFLGSTYAQLKKFPEAIAAFERALKIDPLHASSQFGLARAYQQSGHRDSAHEAMKRFQYVTQNKLGIPISLTYGEQGKYSRAEESPLAVQKVPAQIDVTFVDVTKEAGIVARIGAQTAGSDARRLAPGACFLDYDNDGNIDLLLADNGTQGGMSLYHNLGNGKFEDVTKSAGLDRYGPAISCTAGDYDNDGFADLAVSLGDRLLLLHNEKNGTFRDVTQQAGIAGSNRPSGHSLLGNPEIVSLTFIDYDHDGDVDLYVTRSVAEGSQIAAANDSAEGDNVMWRNNGNGTFTDVTKDAGLRSDAYSKNSLGTDFNNDRAVDLIVTGHKKGPTIFENPREGTFRIREMAFDAGSFGVAALDFDHDGWTDLAFTHDGPPGISLWRNKQGKTFEKVPLPRVDWVRGYGVVAFDYDNDGWVDLAAVGETKDGRGEVRLFRNLGPDGWKDVSVDVGLDKIQLKEPRAIIAGDYDNDGAVDLLITQNHGPAVLLRNVGGNKNNSLRLALKGLNDNKSAIGTKVEVFSDGIRQKFEVYGSSGYLGQNSPYLTIGLGSATQADVVRLLWPTGVLQDETEVAANKFQTITEIDRRGSSCPTLFAWDGARYALVGDMLGAGVVGHWIGVAHSPQGLKPSSSPASSGTAEAVPFPEPSSKAIREDESRIIRNIPRPTEAIKVDRSALRLRDGKLSFRFMEPLEESVYLDQAKLLAVDHPAEYEVYPNEYFASSPPYPRFKVVFSDKKDARPPAGAWDEHGHDVLPSLLAHRYFGDFKVLPFLGFAEPHSLELDLGEAYRGGPLWLLMHGEVEYFSANSMYAADQAGLRPFAPYVEALDGSGRWVRVVDDLGFPAGGARTMTADLSGKLPDGTRRIRLTTNLQIYWDGILISRTAQGGNAGGPRASVSSVPLVRAALSFHGFPLKIEGSPPGNVKYIYEKASATGPYSRPAGAYTRYGDVLPLLTKTDDRYVVFGSGDEVALDFDAATLPAVPPGWVRDYFFVANGYEKDMDFYAYHGDSVDPLPFRDMRAYPYPGQSFPDDPAHLDYLLEYNTRFMSGDESAGYSFRYP
jgi:tetratricopeptide (TPR) repeat protein